ncbi:hypothetical protein [Salinicoccus carnicancri]|uniref:hypothetical protein n=1 Tax=Salinicoccus carnicancri TaxID=558170 RepID=UPI0002D65D37|nr:hypothetical protein [Salinicoccus carnicancri]
MIIQILGNVRYQITLDPSAWIFDDRKEELEKVLAKESDKEEIRFEDSTEWNRQIIEGSSKPPTLKSEKKFKKKDLLEGTFIICLEPFFEYTEPERGEDAMITFTHDEGASIIPYSDRRLIYAQFSHEGRRLYDDGMVDILVIENGEIKEKLIHVTGIKFD